MTDNTPSAADWTEIARRFTDAYRAALSALTPPEAFADAVRCTFEPADGEQSDASGVAATARMDQDLAAVLDGALRGVDRFDGLDDADASVALLFDLLSNPTWGRFELAGGFARMAVALHRGGYRGDPRDGA